MKSCDHSERLVSLLCDGELDGPLRREVASQVAGCTECTRELTSLERIQELLCQTLDEEIERIDFSLFWQGIEKKLHTPAPPLPVRLRLWFEQWRPSFSLNAPVWAAATAAFLLVAFLLTRPYLFSEIRTLPPEAGQLALAANNQAQIESLSAAATVFLWNEPTSNATVIWVGDEDDGGMP